MRSNRNGSGVVQMGKPTRHTNRASDADLRAARSTFLANEMASSLLDAMPCLALVLNPQRQVVAVNRRVLQSAGIGNPEEILGLRPGELLACVHSGEGPDGCGTGPACTECGAVRAIRDCLASRGPSVRHARLRTAGQDDGGALDLEVSVSFFQIQRLDYAVVALRDISGENRRGVLERTFFHDVLNIATGLHSVAELLLMGDDAANEEEYKKELRLMTRQICDEILSQRQLLAAEQGDLALESRSVPVLEILDDVAELYRNHTVARNRTITVAASDEPEIRTDPVLLRRVLGNLVKNALEATPDGGVVSMGAACDGSGIRFDVTNPGVIPAHVQKQIFHRSFSTKGTAGRGIGTHSVKLITERYLKGQAFFASTDVEGTTFSVWLPLSREGMTDKEPAQARASVTASDLQKSHRILAALVEAGKQVGDTTSES